MRTSYQSTAVNVLLAAALSLGGACDAEDVTDEPGVGEAFAAPIPTAYYDAGQFKRVICALGHSKATYYAAITAKEWKFGNNAGPCKDFTRSLPLVLPDQIDWQLCGNLGLQFIVLQGGVNACVNNANQSSAIPLYCHTFSGFYEQVNYNVADWNGQALRTSGWQPPGGNGCPRNGFMW